MQIQFPDLATRTYKDILEEMISTIPKYSEEWTNYNPSDPGIMILETLAWIFDATFYRINMIPEESYINFMTLIAGARGDEVDKQLEILKKDPNSDRYHIEILEYLKEIEGSKKRGQKNKNIMEMKAVALRFINSKYRAITEEDFRSLAIEATEKNHENDPKVKRVEINKGPEGRIDITIISDQLDKYDELKKIVKDYLEPRKLLCTKINVTEPDYSPVNIYIEVVCLLNTRQDMTADRIRKNILEFLDPLKGGDDKKGWGYGRPLTVFELYHIVEETEGVDHARSVIIDNHPALKIKKVGGLIHPVDVTIKIVENR
jgi:hypothetical protein